MRKTLRTTKICKPGTKTVAWRVRTWVGYGGGNYLVSSHMVYPIGSGVPEGWLGWNGRGQRYDTEEEANRAHDEIVAILGETLMPGGE